MSWNTTPFSLSEVEKLENESWYDAVGRVLNNFVHKFPSGLFREMRILRRTLNVKLVTMMHEDEKHNFSEKRANQTGAEFWKEIDETVAQMGIQPAEIPDAVKVAFGSCEKEEGFKRVWQLVIPVYIELRKKGYSPQDLIG